MYNTLSSYAVLEFHFRMLAYNVMAICKCCVVLIRTQFAVSLITNARDFQLFFPLRLGYQVVTPLIRFLRPCMRRRAERQRILGLWHCLVIFFLLFKDLPHRRPTCGNDERCRLAPEWRRNLINRVPGYILQAEEREL